MVAPKDDRTNSDKSWRSLSSRILKKPLKQVT
jgi:hypothetical protein